MSHARRITFNLLRQYHTCPIRIHHRYLGYISRSYSTTTNQNQDQLKQKFNDAGKNLKTRLDKEMENIQQAKKDKDLLDDFLALHQFQVSSSNPRLLVKVVENEEITIDTDPDRVENLLSQDLPEVIHFAVHIKKNNTEIAFKCQYDSNSTNNYSITEMKVRDKKNKEGKEGKEVGLKASNLEETTLEGFSSFLYSRVPPITPQVIDVLLNIRGDDEYLSFLSLTSQLLK